MKRAEVAKVLNATPIAAVVVLWVVLLVTSRGEPLPSFAQQLYLSVFPTVLSSGDLLEMNRQYQFCFVGTVGFAITLLAAISLSWTGRSFLEATCERIGTCLWWCSVSCWACGLLGAAYWFYGPIAMDHAMYVWPPSKLLLPSLRNLAVAGAWSSFCFAVLRPWRMIGKVGWGRIIASGIGLVLAGHLLASSIYVFKGLCGG